MVIYLSEQGMGTVSIIEGMNNDIFHSTNPFEIHTEKNWRMDRNGRMFLFVCLKYFLCI